MFVGVLRVIGHFVFRPLNVLWGLFVRPLFLLGYKLYIVLLERLRAFFHAQHKLIALLSHRFALHVLIGVLTGSIVLSNIAQAQTVQSEDFAKEALISRIFSTQEETIITADIGPSTQKNYLNTDGSVRLVAAVDSDAVGGVNPSVLANASSAVAVKAGGLGETTSTRTEPQQYTVQQGDTISSIAGAFGISTATVLWANNLSDTSLIQPGNTLTILPTSGLQHTVLSGETFESIAKKYNTDADKILEFNRLISNKDLLIGMTLIVPGGEKPVPPPTRTSGTQLATVRNVFFNNPPANAPASSGGKYQWPTTDRRINSPYGYRAFDRWHPGADIEGRTGDPVYASEAGRVTTAGWSGGGYRGGYGIQIVVDHGNGVQTRYAHLSKVYVSSGTSVSRGQTIGAVGATGNAYGDHLHFECIINGRQLNPIGNCL